MTYAGVWPRFAASLLDSVVMSPILALVWWGSEHFRLFYLYYIVPGALLQLFYGVYFVKRFGGTPGKRLMRVRIVRVDGLPVTYREALLRFLPEWLLNTGSSVALVLGVLSLTDAQYLAAPFFGARMKLIQSVAPSWFAMTNVLGNIWFWSEFVVMLTNKKCRAIHDFIAGTVVVKDAQQTPTEAATELQQLPV